MLLSFSLTGEKSMFCCQIGINLPSVIQTLCCVHRKRLETFVLVFFLFRGLELVPLVALTLHFLICYLRGLDWVCGFSLRSWKLWGTPQNQDGVVRRTLGGLFSLSWSTSAVTCLSLGFPKIGERIFMAEKNSLEAAMSFMENHLVYGQVP